MTEQDEEHGPGGMDAIPDEPVDASVEPGGMGGIPDPDPPTREPREKKD